MELQTGGTLRFPPVSVCRQSNCWGEKHVSGIRSVLAQQGSTDCTLRSDLRGIAKAALLRSLFKGGAPFSRKSLLRSVGLTSRSAGNMLLLRCNRFVFSLKRAERYGSRPFLSVSGETPNVSYNPVCPASVRMTAREEACRLSQPSSNRRAVKAAPSAPARW
jgi:hypothetical protein